MNSIQEFVKSGKRGRGLGHVTYFQILVPLIYLRNG